MVDNVQASDQIGSAGAVFATDDVGGIHYPISKITIGALDSAGTLLTGGAGTVDAGCIRVSLATDAAAVTGPVTDTELRATPIVVDLGANNDVTVTSGTITNLSQLGGVAVSLNTGVRDTGTQRVTIATDDLVPVTGTLTAVTTITNDVNIADGGNAITIDWNGTAPPIGAGVEATALRVTLATDSTGLVSVDDNGGSLTTDIPAVATGGATPGKLISAATTNATSVKASAATVYSIQAFNTNAAARYLKIYNKASAPTVGTDVPVQVYTIPGNTAGAGLVVPIPTQGIALSTGFAFALTTGAADSDTGAVALNEIVVSYSYA